MSIIVKPVITEKMTAQGEKNNRYGFVVAKTANKVEIKSAVEKLYGVSVESVNTQNYIGKVKSRNTTRGLAIGRVNKHKKAIVTLKAGETIDFYASI
ncbi:MAG: 50S ribosomal protein L23 [Bacteroidetes bacterium]|nr:50S ribosomal protein L23 [Bacteroidia bacterium]MBN8696252.1 50S ribosomal protein L23 [Bacteroidota bacterium]